MKFQLDSSKPRIFPNTSSPSTGWKFSSWVLSELKVNGTCPSKSMTIGFPRPILVLALTSADSRSISQIPRRNIGSGPDGGIVVARGVARERSNPLALLLLPVVLPPSTPLPLAVLELPVVLSMSAKVPLAVLELPVVLSMSAKVPLAGLRLPVVLLKSALSPMALLLLPGVLPPSESTPLAPFKLLGIDSDNGSEFINYHLKAFCDQRKIQFTRGRPYQKDDNAHIEQKNWTHVRKILGYLRYDSPIALEAINDLYQK